MSTPSPDPTPGKGTLRKRLIAERRALPDRDERSARLERVLLVWLGEHQALVIGAYWPIRGEFDPLPALGAWLRGAPGRRVGLPVIDPATQCLGFRAWYPGCPMQDDAFGIPTPAGSEVVVPDLLLVPCVGFAPGGYRLGYG
ncbi:MAG: 5-formyltetrahydrofolate cyclo-ligase, partial [Chloroflexota bacterium]